MKKLLFIGLAIFSFNVFAGNCTQTTRTNYNALQVLKASDLNADFNQLVNKANAMDGGCISNGTLEPSAFDVVEFATVTNGIHQGCPLIYVNNNTIGIGKCILSVGGNFVKTILQTNVTWGCFECSVEASNTQFYIYAKNGSNGTTLNLLISTTAPGSDGYDSGGNKVLGKFFNSPISNIDERELLSWSNNFFAPTDRILTVPGANKGVDFFSFIFQGAGGPCTSGACIVGNLVGNAVASVTWQSTGVYFVVLNYKYDSVSCSVNYSKFGSGPSTGTGAKGSSDIDFYATNSAGTADNYAGTAFCYGVGKR